MSNITTKNYIVRVAFPFVGDSVGGAQHSILTLANELKNDRAVDVIFFVFQEGGFFELLKKHNHKVIVLSKTKICDPKPRVKIFYQSLLTGYKLSKILRMYKVDIVHTNCLRMHLSWCFAALFSQTRHVWHQRTADDSRRNIIFSFFSGTVVTISDFCRNSMPNLMAKRAQVIFNPVKIHQYDELPKKKVKTRLDEARINKSYRKILYLSNMTNQKRPELFLEIARALFERSPKEKYIFIMVGYIPPSLKRKMEEIILQYQLGEKVILVGPTDTPHEWIRQSTLLVSTSKNEGFGRTLVEASLIGRPSVVSNSGGHIEIARVCKQVVLVKESDVDKYVSEIETGCTRSIEPADKELFSAQRYTQKIKRDIWLIKTCD